MRGKNYTLEWLDFVVNVTLNPSKTQVGLLSAEQAQTIKNRAGQQAEEIKDLLWAHILGLQSKVKTRNIVQQHYKMLGILLDNGHAYAVLLVDTPEYVQAAYLSVLGCIGELLSFIEGRFDEFIGADDRVPLAYLSQIQREVHSRMLAFEKRLSVAVQDYELTGILLHSLESFINGTHDRAVTFREVIYKKELVRAVEKIVLKTEPNQMREALMGQLIYLNFNSRAFMNYYTGFVAARVNCFELLSNKMTELLFCYKQFSQLHYKSGVKLNPDYAGVKEIIGNWFSQEISYLEKKHKWQVGPLGIEKQKAEGFKTETFKLLCSLSVDQIAIILRALDSLRIIQARSMSLVFKSITPFLSTPRKQDISWESIRSKSYNADESDKAVVIKMLEAIIHWVKQY